MSAPLHPIRRAPSALPLAALLAGLALAGCAPERVDMNVHDIFSSDAARYALQSQMPPATLAALGGFLPATTWPADAPPLLLDIQVIAENKIDLAGSDIDVSGFNGVRIHWAQLVATALGGGQLSPRPTKVEMYIGPATATSLSDQGVLPLVSGAFPETLPPNICDGGCTIDAGPADAGSDGGDFDGGGFDAGDFDAGPPTGPDGGSGSDAGSGVDAGIDAGSGASSDGGVAGQTLVFSADAQVALEKLVLAGQPFALFVVLHLPFDTASDPALPTGGADLFFDVQFELAR